MSHRAPITGRRISKLSTYHRSALGLKETPETPPPVSKALAAYYENHPQLKGIPGHVIRKAWFTMAHLLLQQGARVADIGCADGTMTYVMAVLNPYLNFIGVDHDKKLIAQAKENWRAPNLSFQVTDAGYHAGFDPVSLDAIINSFSLHDVNCNARYNGTQVSHTLEYQFSLLKHEGLMYIRDYALQYPGEFVQLEMPATVGTDKALENLSEAELLIWYSENSRPRETPGCHGFFLEEQAPRLPGTRLFRLPYKWAYEFIIRKDDRLRLKAELHKEYAFFAERDLQKTLASLGARTLYTSPHWDANIISRIEGHCRLFDDHGNLLAPPPTSFIAVSRKVGERKSLTLMERRPSQKGQETLRVSSMCNERTGQIVEIASHDIDVTEIIPYRIVDGKLNVFVHEGVPRGIVNAVPRKGKNLDGKRWSGHMVEALALPSDIVVSAEQDDRKDMAKFAQDYMGLRPAAGAALEQGPSYYPAPDVIDEVIKTKFLCVTGQQDAIEPKMIMDSIRGFTTRGRIREIDAQSIIDAVSVGLVPNAKLELQILALFDKTGIEAETWNECPLVLNELEPDQLFDARNFVKLKGERDDRFKKSGAAKGRLRTMQSTFVDEGWVQGGMSGLASRDMEFIISDENTLNKAVILPLTVRAGQIMAGFEVEYLPVPQRHEGNGLSIKAPSVNLPKDVTNIHEAKKYVADLFKVPVENVWLLGEGYFCHAGVTPQRIFPFAVATKGRCENPIGGAVQFAPMKHIWKVYQKFLDWNQNVYFINAIRKGARFLADTNDQRFRHDFGASVKQERQEIISVNSASNIAGLSGSSAARQQS
jgi:hypothetical protein